MLRQLANRLIHRVYPLPGKNAKRAPDSHSSRCLPANWHRVEGAVTLIQVLNCQQLVTQVRADTRFGHNAFARDCQPVVQAVAEYAQQLPTALGSPSESLIPRALQICAIALKLRLGELLPPGAPAEELHRREHRWTYGVFLAALLGEMSHLCGTYTVQYQTTLGQYGVWQPLAGPLSDMQAIAYCVNESEIPHQAPTPIGFLPLTLLQRVVPQQVRQWLAQDLELLNCLCAALGTSPTTNSIGSLVQQARREVDRRTRTTAKHLVPDPIVAATPHERPLGGSAPSNAASSEATHHNQQDLFSTDSGAEQPVPATSPTAAAAKRLWLFAHSDSLSPLLKQTLMAIESNLQAGASAPIQIYNEHAFLVAVEEFERYGTDIGFAITSLSKAGMLLPNASESDNMIHTLHTAERIHKAIAIRARHCLQTSGEQNPCVFDEAFRRAPKPLA